MEEPGNIVQLIDEDGNVVSFDLLISFDYEGKRYVALMPVDKVENVGEDEVVLLEVVKDDGMESYVTIENPVLLDEVFNEFVELFDDMIAENDGDDGEETPGE